MYTPNPINTDDIVLTEDVLELAEQLAKNTHEVWASARVSEGWQYGETRDDTKKLHPCIVPYEDLTEVEKDYDRRTSLETLKLIIKLGYKIVKD